MLTRREMLAATLAVPFVPIHSFPEPQVLAEPHTLSRESAAGFRSLLKTCERPRIDLIIVPAAHALTVGLARNLLDRARAGAWLILESGLCFEGNAIREQQTRIWAESFALSFAPFRAAAGVYVEYIWPAPKMVRSFDVFTPLSPGCGTIMAQCDGTPACCTRRLGRGGIVFLGAMLGPGLAAGEREAHELGVVILASIGRV